MLLRRTFDPEASGDQARGSTRRPPRAIRDGRLTMTNDGEGLPIRGHVEPLVTVTRLYPLALSVARSVLVSPRPARDRR